MKTYVHFLILLFLLLVTPHSADLLHAQDMEEWEEPDAILVGRISHVEGELSRYDSEADAWVSTTREGPFGLDDLLRTDIGARAEIILPNNTWVRIDGDTRIQLTALTPQTTEVDVTNGTGRLYNKSMKTEITATTPYGRITAPPGAVFDLFVSESGIDITAIRKSVHFFHNASGQRHEVRSNSSALFADMQAISAVTGEMDPDWVAWNRSMDDLWAGRMESRGESTTYLPPELHSEAHALDKHGHWERVYYEGRYYRFWRPVQVSAHWSPFSWGAWIVWHGDHVWVPHEPFGYVTHHYGNWIFTAGHWYWAPPVTRITIRARLPLLHIGFGWYPGRVSWIHSGAHVGWIPLAPHEPYYTHRHWGRRSIVVSGSARYHRPHHHHRYRHRHHAVVIHRSHLYRSKNYRHARIRHISHDTIRHKFRSARLLDRKIVRDHKRLEKRDRFHHKDKRHNQKYTKEHRHLKNRRLYARHGEGDRHLRRDHRRPDRKKELRPSAKPRTRERGAVRPHRGIDRRLKKELRTEKKRRVGSVTGTGKHKEYKDRRGHKDRRIQKRPGGENKERPAQKRNLRKQRELESPSGRRFVQHDTGKTTPHIRSAKKNRTARRYPSAAEGASRPSASKKAVHANKRDRKDDRRVSRHHKRTHKPKEVSRQRPQPRIRKDADRDNTRRLRSRSNRAEANYKVKRDRRSIRPSADLRSPPPSVRRPAAKRSSENGYSVQQRRPQRSVQRWQAPTGRQSGGRETSDRNRTRKGRHHRN